MKPPDFDSKQWGVIALCYYVARCRRDETYDELYKADQALDAWLSEFFDEKSLYQLDLDYEMKLWLAEIVGGLNRASGNLRRQLSLFTEEQGNGE